MRYMNFKAFLPCYDGKSVIKVHNRGRKCEHNAYCDNRCATCENDIEYVHGKWIYWDKFGRIFQKESDTNHYLISELMDELIPETIRQAVPDLLTQLANSYLLVTLYKTFTQKRRVA